MEWTVNRALLELNGNGQLGEDEEPLAEVFAQRGVTSSGSFQRTWFGAALRSPDDPGCRLAAFGSGSVARGR